MEVLSPGTCEGDSIRNGVFADVVSRDEVALEQGRLVSGEERASNKDPGRSCDDGDRGRSDTSTGPGVPRSAATAEIRKDQESLAPSERTWLCDPTGDFRPERLGTRTFLLLSAIESMAIHSSSSRQQIETPTAKREPRLESPRPSRPREPAPPRHPRASRLLPQREERPATREVTCPRGKSRVRAGSPQTLRVGS